MSLPLAQAHLLEQERIRALVARMVSAAWAGLPGYDRADVNPFLEQAVPVVLAGQRASAQLVDTFIARSLGRRPVGINPTLVTGAAVRNGVAPETVYERSFVTVWSALGAGVDYEQAVAEGLHRATSTAAMDVQLAHRAAYGAIEQVDDRIRGYRRVADGSACNFCLAVSGAFVKSANAMGLHNHCGCGLDPIIETVEVSPLPDTVAVHEHGELGAVLGDPSHVFTQL